MNRHKYIQLDSLRGIAAVLVAFWHYFLINHEPTMDSVIARPWRLYLAGPESVLLFFVLSGFVLSVMLDRQKSGSFSYKEYLIRRVFRLYPVYYCALVLSLVVFLFLAPAPIKNLSTWFNMYAEAPINLSFVLKYCAMIYGFGNKLNNVTWSLTYEMLISLIFPLFFTLVMHSLKISWRKIGSYLLLIVSYFVIVRLLLHVSLVSSLYYAHFFVAGILIYKFQNTLQRFSGGRYLVLGLLFYFLKFITFNIFNSSFVYNECTLLGTLLIIISALSYQPLISFLSTRVFVFYGNISYSFYLIHLPILYGCVYLLYGKFTSSLLTVSLIAFVGATSVSYVSYCLIEKKFILYGKLLAR